MPAPVPVYSVGGGAVDARPVAILLDPISSGSAERVPWALQVAGRALVVGAESEGAIGTVYRVPVDGFTAYVNADLCLDTEGVPLEGRGVPVDLPVSWSRADVEAGTDTVVEAARRALLGP
jgi:carboxyl-terminal processing protease